MGTTPAPTRENVSAASGAKTARPAAAATYPVDSRRKRARSTAGLPDPAPSVGPTILSSRFPRLSPWSRFTLLLLGPCSIALLLWEGVAAERRAADAAIANAVMDLRIRAAASQIWTERALAGGPGLAARERASSLIHDVRHLAGVITGGGRGKDGLAVSPSTDPVVKRSVAEVEQLASEWVSLTRARLAGPPGATGPREMDVAGRAAFDALQARASGLEWLIEAKQVTDIASWRDLFALRLVAWSVIVVAFTTSLWRHERARVRTEAEIRSGADRLEAVVAEQTSALRRLNTALLTAQEAERHRISNELHDQLGHALILMKMRLALIARDLPPGARAGCDELGGHVDATLEDVRRLARDLRPAVLEELGLSSALKWLADSCSQSARPVQAVIEDVDPQVPRASRVTVYRIVQQALCNAARHSRARHVALTVRRDREEISFVVEDDGEGFDPARVAAMDPGHGGLGLATMAERAAMIGGTLSVWSQIGKGTRIALSVPVPRGEAS